MKTTLVENGTGDFWKFESQSGESVKLLESRCLVANTFYIDVSCEYSLIAEFSTQKEFFIKRDSNTLNFAPGKYLLFKPPYTITEIAFTEKQIRFEGVLTKNQQNSPPSQEALLLSGGENYPDLLKRSTGEVFVSRQSSASGIAEKIKRAIDQNYRAHKSLKEIARDLRLSPSLLTSYFKRSFYITPNCYRKYLRLKSSSLQILHEGENLNLSEIAFENGYGDISRFNKQFKAFTGTTPLHLKRGS